MSTSAGIRIYFRDKISPSSLVRRLIECGWGLDPDVGLQVLTPGNFDAGDWEFIEDKDVSYLLKWSKAIDHKRGGFGFLVVHQASGIGGAMIMDVDRSVLAWGVSVNIPHLLNERELVDFSKCLCTIWPAINSEKFGVNRFEMFSE